MPPRYEDAHDTLREPPRPPTECNTAAADAVQNLSIEIVARGMKGEIFKIPVSTLDFAWILSQKLKGKGWMEETVRRVVEEWTEAPMLRFNTGRG